MIKGLFVLILSVMSLPALGDGMPKEDAPPLAKRYYQAFSTSDGRCFAVDKENQFYSVNDSNNCNPNVDPVIDPVKDRIPNLGYNREWPSYRDNKGSYTPLTINLYSKLYPGVLVDVGSGAARYSGGPFLYSHRSPDPQNKDKFIHYFFRVKDGNVEVAQKSVSVTMDGEKVRFGKDEGAIASTIKKQSLTSVPREETPPVKISREETEGPPPPSPRIEISNKVYCIVPEMDKLDRRTIDSLNCKDIVLNTKSYEGWYRCLLATQCNFEDSHCTHEACENQYKAIMGLSNISALNDKLSKARINEENKRKLWLKAQHDLDCATENTVKKLTPPMIEAKEQYNSAIAARQAASRALDNAVANLLKTSENYKCIKQNADNYGVKAEEVQARSKALERKITTCLFEKETPGSLPARRVDSIDRVPQSLQIKKENSNKLKRY